MGRLGVFAVLSLSMGLCACAPDDAPWGAGQRGYPSIPNGYYNTADTSTAASLRTSLHAIIDDHERIRYTYSSTDTWNVLEEADEDPADSERILDVYMNASYPKHSEGNSDYNREHSWPSSYGFPTDLVSSYPYTDCHHLFLSNDSYNSSRSNKPFADCDADCSEKTTLFNDGVGGGSGIYPGNSNWTTGSGAAGSWQAWGGRKGDVARALLYMDVRYEGGTHGLSGAAEPDLVLTDNRSQIITFGSNTSGTAHMGMRAMLIAWHNADPPDARELRRNDVVFSYQGNRNPFIDHPEWVDCVFSNNCGGSADLPPGVNVFSPAGGSDVTDTVTIKINASDAEDSTGSLDVKVSIDGGNLQTASYNTTSGSYELSWDTTAGADGSHTIDARATDSASQTTHAAQVSVTVTNAPPPPPGQSHVGDLDGAAQKAGKNWKASVSVAVHDEGHAAVAAATVSGSWGDGSSGSCTTDASGVCTVTSAKLANKTTSLTFRITNVNHATLLYQAAANHDPDGDSDGSLITVFKDGTPPLPTTPPTGDIHVGDLDGSGRKVKGKFWQSVVTVAVHDAGHAPVSGVAVSGTFSGGASGSASCTTDSSGSCDLRSPQANTSQPSITFMLSALSHASLGYDASMNHDPDSDSDGNTITVGAP